MNYYRALGNWSFLIQIANLILKKDQTLIRILLAGVAYLGIVLIKYP